MSEFVEVCGDVVEVFEFVEEVFDEVVLVVDCWIDRVFYELL